MTFCRITGAPPMATSPPSTPKSAASAGSSGWVLEAKGKDPGSLNISRDISTAANQSITVRPGTQFTMKPSGKFKVDKGAETAETAKWGDDLLVTVPGGGQILLKGFYNKSPNAPASKMVIEQKKWIAAKSRRPPWHRTLGFTQPFCARRQWKCCRCLQRLKGFIVFVQFRARRRRKRRPALPRR